MTVTEPHWTTRFIGVPHEKGANGPDAFNCLFYVAHVQRERFGQKVPLVEQPEQLGAIVRAFRDGEQDAMRSGWAKVAKPRTGDIVLMAHMKYPSHIGIFVDDVAGGSVLHSLEGHGSALHSLFHLAAGRWRITGYYRPASEA